MSKKSGYLVFCAEERPVIKEDCPDIKNKEVMTELGKRWKALSDEERADFNARAKEEREANPEPPKKKKSESKEKGKKTKEKSSVKKPKNAYIFFCETERQKIKDKYPDLKSKDIMSKLGENWKKLKPNQKVPFEKKAKEDKERYDSEKGTVVEVEEDEVKEKASTKGKKGKKVEVSDDEETPVPKANAKGKKAPVPETKAGAKGKKASVPEPKGKKAPEPEPKAKGKKVPVKEVPKESDTEEEVETEEEEVETEESDD